MFGSRQKFEAYVKSVYNGVYGATGANSGTVPYPYVFVNASAKVAAVAGGK